MKTGIHPTWHKDAQVTCSCGNAFTVGSVYPTLTVDICSKCHPFFTGEVRFVDRQGRVDKFLKKMQAAQNTKAAKTSKKAKKDEDTTAEDTQTYQDILRAQQLELKKAAKPQVQ